MYGFDDAELATIEGLARRAAGRRLARAARGGRFVPSDGRRDANLAAADHLLGIAAKAQRARKGVA